jgi:FKBP-type peptidyl-prolyl cis-trans isomerase SlyD
MNIKNNDLAKMKIEKGDFVEIEYTGKIKDDNTVFDTTDEKIAKENNLHGHEYGPAIICIGQEQVLKGIDDNLLGKEVGKEYGMDIKPEDAFGSKDSKLIQLIRAGKFKQQNIQPMPGLQVNIDGMVGTIKTAGGGRTLVDFNHPLAGRELSYVVKVNKKILDDAEKLKGFIKISLGPDCQAEVKESNAKISLKSGLPSEVQDNLRKKITELIPKLKKIEFVFQGAEKNK